MVSLTDLQLQRAQILRIAAEHGAEDLRVFGSVARGEQGEHSDIDLLVRMAAGRNLLDKVGLLQDLQDLLGCRVDLAELDYMHPRLRARAVQEAVTL